MSALGHFWSMCIFGLFAFVVQLHLWYTGQVGAQFVQNGRQVEPSCGTTRGKLVPSCAKLGSRLGPRLCQLGANLGQVGTKLGQVGAKLIKFGTNLEPSWALMGQVGLCWF